MLTGLDGTPAEPEDIPPDYPVTIAWDGVLVDDEGHRRRDGVTCDILARVREVLGVLFPDSAEAIEQEACEILGAKDLRSWFRTQFFPIHIKRYSKSRRKAPIYWQLGTESTAYSVWLYYHRLTPDTLFLVLRDYVDPKIEHEERRLAELDQAVAASQETGSRSARAAIKARDDQQAFLGELYRFRDRIREVAEIHDDRGETVGYAPDLNDGVLINIAPLWKVVPWKEGESAWRELEKGSWDWSEMAKRLWPARIAGEKAELVAEPLIKYEAKAAAGKGSRAAATRRRRKAEQRTLEAEE